MRNLVLLNRGDSRLSRLRFRDSNNTRVRIGAAERGRNKKRIKVLDSCNTGSKVADERSCLVGNNICLQHLEQEQEICKLRSLCKQQRRGMRTWLPLVQ